MIILVPVFYSRAGLFYQRKILGHGFQRDSSANKFHTRSE
jgi:hypothetical protein